MEDDGDDQVSQMNRYPLSRDEPEIRTFFSGRSFCKSVILNSWTNRDPKHFVDLEFRYSSSRAWAYSELDYKNKMEIKRMISNRISIEDLWKEIPKIPPGKVIEKPIQVIVVSKHFRTFLLKKEIAMIGSLHICDFEGKNPKPKLSFLELWNECIDSIYNRVKPGDVLLIGKYTHIKAENFDKTEKIYRPPFEKDNYLDFGLKIYPSDSKETYKMNANAHKLPPHLFQKTRLWTPTRILGDFNSIKENHIDIIGIISYVSRIERSAKYTGELFVGSRRSTQTVTEYFAFRWITIIDSKSPEPIRIKVTGNLDTWDQLQNLTPKTMIVLTNVVLYGHAGLTYYFATSQFTTIYTGSGIANGYSMLMPRETYGKVIADMDLKETLSREDVNWSAGGTLENKIEDPFTFGPLARKGKKYLDFPSRPYARRQTSALEVCGVIYKYFIVVNNVVETTWISNTYRDIYKHATRSFHTAFFMRRTQDGKTLVIPQWYSFQRKLPPGNTQAYANLLKPLSLPSIEPGIEGIQLKNCEISDQNKAFCIVHFYDDLNFIDYVCIWKLKSAEWMKTELEKRRGVNILTLINLHCIDHSSETGEEIFDVILHDITAIPKDFYK